jgi:hypothetical protein
MGARLLREQELNWLFAASAAGGSTSLLPDLMTVVEGWLSRHG